jgi:hypothetical protein
VEQEGYIFFMDIVAYSKKTTDEQKKANLKTIAYITTLLQI